VDWNKIKSEYITDDASSYTKLAKKYGIARSTIANRAGREGWASDKERYRNDLVTKTVAAVQKKQVDKMQRIQDITDKLLDKLEQAVNELDRQLLRDVTKVKEIEYNNDLRPDKPTKEVITEREIIRDVSTIIDRAGLKAIASALRDIKEVQMLKTELDKQEQEARIANLRKQADKDDNAVSEIEITFAAGPEEWNE
jgi:monoamine oxidase